MHLHSSLQIFFDLHLSLKGGNKTEIKSCDIAGYSSSSSSFVIIYAPFQENEVKVTTDDDQYPHNRHGVWNFSKKVIAEDYSKNQTHIASRSNRSYFTDAKGLKQAPLTRYADKRHKYQQDKLITGWRNPQ